MSKHKERLRKIREIRAAQAQEAEMIHVWLRDVASDQEVDAIAAEIETAKLTPLADLDISAEERERIRQERLDIMNRAIEVRDRMFKWIALQRAESA